MRVALHADGLTAQTEVWLGPEGVEQRLDDFFSGLASDWRGWSGSRVWDGMEGGLSLGCRNTGNGPVQIDVTLRHLSGSDWTTSATVEVDAGAQMSAIAADLARLLSPVG